MHSDDVFKASAMFSHNPRNIHYKRLMIKRSEIFSQNER